MELSTSAYAILGFIRLGPLDEPRHAPRSGYDIKRSMEIIARVFWNISPAQIYPELKKLEAAGFVSGRSDPHGKRARRVFELTPKGEQALREWLERDDPAPIEIRDLAMLKLLFADAAEPEVAIEMLRAMRERSEAVLRALVAAYPTVVISEAKGDTFPMRTGRISAAIHQAIVEETRAMELELEQERPSTRQDRGGRKRASRGG